MMREKKPHLTSPPPPPHRRRRSDPAPPSPRAAPPPPSAAPKPGMRRSLRPRTATLCVGPEYESTSSEEERDRERRRMKSGAAPIRKPAPAPARDPVSSDSDSDSSTSFSSNGEDDAVKPPKKRRMNGRDESDGEERKKNSFRRSKVTVPGRTPESTKGTRLPERKIMEEVLDKLQKKDTYGVYGQPVDSEELPDYYEVIEHPMDFGTVRKKLTRGVYRTFEQFEDDVFLICSNAMQYNAPHTVYFRQARAIEEMGRKMFEILRTDGKLTDTERKSEEKNTFNSTEKKQLKKPLYGADKGSLGSDISSSGTLASVGDICTGWSMKQANGVKIRRSNVNEKPANSNGSNTPRTNVVKKASSSIGFMSPADAARNHVSANGLSKAHTGSAQKPSTSNGFSAARTKTVERPLVAKKLTKEKVNVVEKFANVNRSSTPQAKSVEKPATANGLSKTQANAVEKAGNRHQPNLLRANHVEKPETPTTSDGLSMKEANATEKPPPSNGLSEEPVNAVEQSAPTNIFAECSSSLDESRSEMVDDFSAKCSPSKLGRKPILVDENRRATYNQYEEQPAFEANSVFQVFDSEPKQLVDVGTHSEYAYATSLSRFAACLGPVGWEIASKEIEKALPAGIKFGPGWVGEYEPPPTPMLSLEKQNKQSFRYHQQEKQNKQNLGNGLQCRGSMTDAKTGPKSNATRNADYGDMQVGVNSQANIGMVQRAYQPKGIFSCEQKQGFLGTSTETQPRITSAMLPQHKSQLANSPNAFSEVSRQIRPCNSSSISSASIDKTLQRPNLPSEAQMQKLPGVSADVQQRLTSVVSQKKKDREVDFTKAGTNVSEQNGVSNSISSIPAETDSPRPGYHSQAQKQMIFGVPSISQPRIPNAMLHQQKNQVDVDVSKACNGALEQVRVCNSRSVNGVPAEAALQRDQHHFQSQKQGLFGVSAEAQRRISTTMLHNDETQRRISSPVLQNDQAAINFMKAYSDVPEHLRAHNPFHVNHAPVEKDLQKNVNHSEAATNCWPQELIARNRNQLQEHQRMAGSVNSHTGKDALGLSVGGLSSQKFAGISDSRGITSLDFISNRQSGVAGYPLAGGSQAIDFRLMDLSGKISNQPNISGYSATQIRSAVPPPTRDDSSAVAARAWMSFGASGECRSVDATSVHTQIGSVPSYNPGWRTPAAATRGHGDSMIRSSQVPPQPMPPVNEESQNENRGLAFFKQLSTTDVSRFNGHPSWQGLSPRAHPRQKDSHPPDLNIGYQPPASPARLSSGMLVDSQQPDLALQL